MPQAIVSNFAIWLTSTNSSKKGDPVKLLTWVENKRGIVWDENGEKEEKERGNETINEKERKWVGGMSKKRCMDTASSNNFVNEYKMDSSFSIPQAIVQNSAIWLSSSNS